MPIRIRYGTQKLLLWLVEALPVIVPLLPNKSPLIGQLGDSNQIPLPPTDYSVNSLTVPDMESEFSDYNLHFGSQ